MDKHHSGDASTVHGERMIGDLPVVTNPFTCPAYCELAGAVLTFQGWKFLQDQQSSSLRLALDQAAEMWIPDWNSFLDLPIRDMGRCLAGTLRWTELLLMEHQPSPVELYAWTRTRPDMDRCQDKVWPGLCMELARVGERLEDLLTRMYLSLAVQSTTDTRRRTRRAWYNSLRKELGLPLPSPGERDRLFDAMTAASGLLSKTQWEVITLWRDLLTFRFLCHLGGNDRWLDRAESCMAHQVHTGWANVVDRRHEPLPLRRLATLAYSGFRDSFHYLWTMVTRSSV